MKDYYELSFLLETPQGASLFKDIVWAKNTSESRKIILTRYPLAFEITNLK
jgi:hypothetical protein